jgi:Zn-dependent protease
MNGLLQALSINALPVLMAITLHEAAHGYVAWRKGDPTAKMLGRVTLNPIAHVDPVGTVLIPGLLILSGSPFLFGWAKPVPVNVRLLHDQKRDPIYVAAAGVVTNLMLAGVSAFLFRLIGLADPDAVTAGRAYAYMRVLPGAGEANPVLLPLALMLARSVQFNLLLAFFNLIPIPPLDGGRIATGILPFHASMWLASLERYGMLLVPLLLWINPFGIMNILLGLPINLFTGLLLGGLFFHGG